MKGRSQMEQENKEELTEDLRNMETKDLIKLLVKKMGQIKVMLKELGLIEKLEDSLL